MEGVEGGGMGKGGENMGEKTLALVEGLKSWEEVFKIERDDLEFEILVGETEEGGEGGELMAFETSFKTSKLEDE